MTFTPRWNLPYPELTDGPSGADVPFWMKAMALALDSVAMDDQGTLTNRPVSTALVPGKKGHYYMVKGDGTAANNGLLWRDNGTGWDLVGSNGIVDTKANRPAGNAVPVGTRFFATDQIAEWISDGTNWIRLGIQCGDIDWTNETVRTGYILLEGQAWPSTTGIYADLHTLWGGSNLPDARGRDFTALGTNARVNALLDNDGVAVANRAGNRHRHTLHTHAGGDLVALGASDGEWNTTTSSGDHRTGPVIGADGGSNVATDPLDGGAFLVLQPQAKL